MSVVVPFPQNRVAPMYIAAVPAPRRNGRSASIVHPVRGGTVISWLHTERCHCCGRPTLRGAEDGEVFCGYCTPPHAA